ncbi:FAD:protein FMN transferase [candidate division WOR-3 bacterium]|nr:FAD:protein FMN transferase [candidate division WOR-3 bacterium]MCK4527339.1 FAD:protein FMN transferase [candidate division WOR-3 bacterium]
MKRNLHKTLSLITIIGLAIVSLSLIFIFITTKKYIYQGFFFDTYLTVKIYARNPFKARETIQRLKREFERIDNLPVNGIKSGRLDTTLIHIITKGMEISRMTDGSFDPTVDPILKKWNYFKEPVIPKKESIDSLLMFVDYRKVIIKGDSLYLPKGMSLCIGGIAKGYILNRAKNILEEMGISSGLIEAGGDIVLIGKKKGKEEWQIGVRHPRMGDRIIGTCKLSNCFIATSGDYERYFFYDKIRYHHIVNPSNGFPAREIQSVTVIGDNGEFVDGYSTALFAMELNEAIDFIRKNQLDAIIVDSSGIIHNFTKTFKLEGL